MGFFFLGAAWLEIAPLLASRRQTASRLPRMGIGEELA
jgi:hypothetical protein